MKETHLELWPDVRDITEGVKALLLAVLSSAQIQAFAQAVLSE